jgi:parvulin-like peptidyl-prolyl isomerase
MKVKIFIVLFLSLVFAGRCSNAQQEGRVLAEVNGSKLTYEFLMDQFPEEYQASITKDQLGRAVEAWIETELIYQEALKQNVDKEKRVKNIIQQKSKDIIAARFIDLSVTMDDIGVGANVDSIYAANQDLFTAQEPMYRLSHIILASKGGADAVYKRLLSGDDFNALVRDYSEDEQSRKNNGEIGLLAESGLEPNLMEALREAQEGGYTKPIQSQSGYYHIFWVKEKIASGTLLKLDDIREEIIESIKADNQQTAYTEMLNRLMDAADIKRNSLDGIITK